MSKSFEEGEWEKRENNGGDEPNICIYGNVTMKPPAQLSYTNLKHFLKTEWL
jgi:hypothetical protein